MITKNPCFDQPSNVRPVKTTSLLGSEAFMHGNTLPASGLKAPHNMTHLEKDGDLADMDVDTFLRIFSSQHDYVTHEVSMRQWIQRTAATLIVGGNSRSEEVLLYVQSALPIALKLTDAVIGPDTNSAQIMIPLASIASENVYIQTRREMESEFMP